VVLEHVRDLMSLVDTDISLARGCAHTRYLRTLRLLPWIMADLVIGGRSTGTWHWDPAIIGRWGPF
jgi:hypothetical protein